MLSKRIPISNDNFGIIRRKQYLYVDKSLLIKDIITKSADVTLITRPRRWGKTMNMSMLQHFFAAQVDGQPTQDLFNDLAITKDKASMAHQGQYPVIFVTFKGIKGSTYEEIFEQFKTTISKLFKSHLYLLKSEKLSKRDKVKFNNCLDKQINLAELEESISFLSECLHQHTGRQAYILIDEYDSPLNHLFDFPETKTTHDSKNKSDFKRVSDLLSALLTACLKGNPHLEKGIMTGILRVAKANMFSSLNNVDENTLLDDTYAPYFGFTEAEVNALFIQKDLKGKLNEAKQWYNGYRVGEHVLYNPWSIMNCLMKKGMLRPYWVNTSEDTLIRRMAAKMQPRLQDKLELLISGNPITVSVTKHITYTQMQNDSVAFWSLLLFSGYLKVEQHSYLRKDRYRCRLSIPNKEVQDVFVDLMSNWLTEQIDSELYDNLIEALKQGNLDDFTKGISGYLMQSASVHDMARKPLESFYHGFILAIMAGLTSTHYVSSNRESGHGRFDIMLLPKSVKQSEGIILEFKAIKDYQDIKVSALEAVQQITNKRYDEDVKQYTHIKRILKVGMAFCGKHVTSAYQTKDMRTEKEGPIAYTTTFSSGSESSQSSDSEEKKVTTIQKQQKQDLKKSVAVLTRSKKRKRDEKTQQDVGSALGDQDEKSEKEEGMTSQTKRVKTSEEKPSTGPSTPGK